MVKKDTILVTVSGRCTHISFSSDWLVQNLFLVVDIGSSGYWNGKKTNE